MFKARPAAETRERDFAVKIEDLRSAREDLSKWTENLRRRYGYPNLASSARRAPEAGRSPSETP